MKTEVVYFTRTKHTEKMARVVADVCGVEAINITEQHRLFDVDCLFIGTGIYGGKPSAELFRYIDDLPVNQIKHAVIFSSNFTKKDQTELLINNLRAKGIEVYPRRFVTTGSFLFLKRKRPNEKDLVALRRFTIKALQELGGNS
ncbi:flavodoxin domain-containing protein [Anaerorhabdus furcosa]|uniref:Flavodoxin n=1 Tax=Anaerorhabdus furcosa TaxID=118967 RepID=A0A1T4MK29_9FIRM|nr:flavodoxin domain-containing protein [Anaerorhabdus furcosa]SJZ67108.1 Flavodoxin [Anaerorhabdus furcosa]